MTLKHSLSALSLAIAAAMPLALFTAPGAAAAPAVSVASMGVQQVRQILPGEVLSFTLDGTPGAAVSLQIAGAAAPVRMRETRRGHYEGEYTVRLVDRLSAASLVTSRIVKDGHVASATLSQSLVLGAPPPAAVQTVQITDFEVDGPHRVRPGDELGFKLAGTAGGKAAVSITGVAKPVALRETSRGVYEGSYVVRRQDSLRGEWVANASLLSDRREATQRYAPGHDSQRGERGQDEGSRADAARDAQSTAVATCAACGTIESVDRVEVDGHSPNVIGTIAGGVLGGVIGRQVGGGSGKDLATVLGAVGGAYAGNRIENSRDKVQVYRVGVRLDGGTVQNFDYAQDPEVKLGTRVKVENAVLVRL